MSIPTPKKPMRRWWKQIIKEDNTRVRKIPASSSQEASFRAEKPHTIQRKRKSSGGSWMIFFILVVFLIVWWTYRDSISSFVKNPNIDTGQPISGANNLFVGKELLVEWTIERNTNKKYSYTHTLEDTTHGVLWLRSSTINLYGLSWTVALAGKIVDFTNNIYILEINSIVDADEDDALAWEILYFDKPWLLLQNIIKDGFVITQNKSTQSINLTNALTKANINIRYFVCGTDKTNNCGEFVKSFENTSGAQSIDSYDNVFYKLNDENTWFTNIDNRYGVSIETSNPQLFSFIVEKTQFITLQWAQEHLELQALQYCQQDDKRLQKITSSTLTQNTTWFNWSVTGTDSNLENISCTLAFSPDNLEKNITATLHIEKTKEEPSEPVLPEDTEDDSSSSDQNTNIPNSSSKQFPLKPGKELLFTTQGMTILFPSPNIAFSSINSVEEIKGVKCYAKTYVIEYAKKDQLMLEPSLIISFCWGDVTILESNMRKITHKGATLVIQVLDPSWTDFANAIILQ